MKGIVKALSAGSMKLANFIRHDLRDPLDMAAKLADKAVENTVKTFVEEPSQNDRANNSGEIEQ